MALRAWRRNGAVMAGAASLGWAFGTILAGLTSITPAGCALLGAGAGSLWSILAASRRPTVALQWPWLGGILALALPRCLAMLRARGPATAFERVGLLWLGGEWRHADPAVYLTLMLLGAVMALICLGMLWLARRDRSAAWLAGLTSLALAAVWRTMVFPPSGDEPTLLLAAGHWLATGSLDIAHAAGTPAELMSRAIDVRADLPFHTVGAPGGAVYTFHGLLLTCLYGIGLALGGRFGLALLLVGLAALAVRLTERVAVELLGHPVPPRWILAMLAGGPLAVYTIFMSADLMGAALFALGAFGLVRRRPALVALAAIALPWMNHKLLFTAVGLLLAQCWLARGAGAMVCAAFALGFIPEVLLIARALELPLWPPSEFIAHKGHFSAAGLHIFHLSAFVTSIPGVLIHRYAGLVNYPGWALAIAGCVWVFRSGGRPSKAVLIATFPYLGVILFNAGWEAGEGSPGRTLVMVFPCLALGLAALEGWLRGTWRAVLAFGIWLGIVVAQVEIFIPPIGYVSAKLKLEAAAVAQLGFDPLAILPDFSGIDGRAGAPGWLAAVWLGMLGWTWILCVRRMRNRSRRTA